MTPVAIIYFLYMFIGFYFLIFTLLLYFKNRKLMNFHPAITQKYSISVIIPAFNEEKTIKETIEAVYAVDYSNIKDVIVVNDGSKDRTLEIARALSNKYKTLKVMNKPNSGKADSLNYALKRIKTDLFVVVDADSFPSKDSFKKMVGFFDDPTVGAVTATCVPRNNKTFLEKLQVMEYKVIAFTRKLLEFIDSIYVAPGSLSIYRKAAIDSIGGFDTKNITEDIELTWRALKNDWHVRMAFGAYATTTVPNRIAPWYKQRRRWSLGGLQCIQKYKGNLMRKNMFGYFVIPFFTVGLFLGLAGIILFLYLLIRRGISTYLLTKYSIETSVPLLTMNELLITPSVLNYFGIILFILFFMFNAFVLSMMKDKFLERQSFFNLLFYMTIYLLVYPVVLLASIWHFYKGRMIWR